ncbi:hypothetical protein RUND412_011184, partial [Rhizina undulata]
MVAFLVFIVSTFAHAAPLTNSNNSTAIVPLWVPAPQGRGTIDIFLTCLFTIAICVWTALHLNIDTRPWLRGKLLITSLFVASGIFWPEFVLLVSAKQWIQAKDLRQRIRTHRLGKEQSQEDFSPEISAQALRFFFANPSDQDCQGLTLEIAFYAIMGGFVCKSNSSHPSSEEQSDCKKNTLTPDAFLEILKKNLLSMEAMKKLHDDVKALSKTDVLAKVLACTQASWFVVQCIARKASGLPVLLIELHTVTHVMCALVIFLFWLRKPQHVTHRIFIDDYVDKTVLDRKQEQDHATTSTFLEQKPSSCTTPGDESETSLLANSDAPSGEQYDNDQISDSETYITTEKGIYVSLKYARKLTPEESNRFFSELEESPHFSQTELWNQFRSQHLNFVKRADNTS